MIAITFALEYESAAFRARHTLRLRESVWILGVMGRPAGDALRKRLDAQRPDLVLSAGFAGALQSGIQAGDLILGLNHSSPEIAAQIKLPARWRAGDVLTEEAIIEQGAEKRRLGETTGALAGDLETAHLAAVCFNLGIPMLSVRSISDTIDDDMPVPSVILLNPATGRPNPMGLFKHLIRNPGCIPSFNKLLKNARAAQFSLAAGLEELLPQLLGIV